MPEIGPPGSESGGRKRTHGTRPAARLRKRRISHRPLPATRLSSTLLKLDIRDRQGVAGRRTGFRIVIWGLRGGCGASHGAMAGRGEPECRQLLLETVRIVPEGAWCGGTDGLSGTCAECEGDALPCLALRRGPRQMQNEPADRADDLDPELEQSVA